MVIHQDTDGDRRFEYEGPPYDPSREQLDGPYPSQSDSSKPGVRVEVTYVGE